MKLQERDQRLLQMLFRFGVMSTRQIAQAVFPGVALATVLRRLRILEDSKIIINCGHLKDGSKVWCIGKAGGNIIGQDDIFYFRNQNTLQHDVCLTDARLQLETMGLGLDWTSEAELKHNQGYYQRGGLVPDGIFTVEVFRKTQVIAFELELSAKAHLRYKKIFCEYKRMDAIGVIWYVLKDKSIAKPILKQWQIVQSRSQQTLLLTELNDLLNNGELARVSDITGKSWPLKAALNLKNSDQGQSRFSNPCMSTQALLETKSDQAFTSAPDSNLSMPSALDPSHSTSCLLWKGSRPTGINNTGAEVLRGKGGIKKMK